MIEEPPPYGGGLMGVRTMRMGAKAYFLTWTTYGTWLPGDSRGWVDRHRRHGEIVEPPDAIREESARKRMRAAPVTLSAPLRPGVAESIRHTAEHCRWCIHALDVRSNHVHVVISSPGADPGRVMGRLKAYASRRLNQVVPAEARPGRWWTRQGSKRRLFTDEALCSAVRYVRNQDKRRRKG